MAFIVQTTNPTTGDAFWLKRTTWAFARERAERFETSEAALAQLDKSRKFNKPWAAKYAYTIEVED